MEEVEGFLREGLSLGGGGGGWAYLPTAAHQLICCSSVFPWLLANAGIGLTVKIILTVISNDKL